MASGSLLKRVWCILSGHDWRVLSTIYYKYDPVTCIEQHNPFALVQCDLQESDMVGTKKRCLNCGLTISYEEPS